MITVKDKIVTFTGKDEKNLKELAIKLGVTPQQALVQALERWIAKEDKAVKKEKHECDNSYADEMYHLSSSKKTKRNK